MKQKLFLTSTVSKVANHIASSLDMDSNNKLVFIQTASEPEIERGGDMQWLEDDKNALLDAGFDVNPYTIKGKNKEQLGLDLKDYDYIYMSGGDAIYLLEQSVSTGFVDVVRDLVLTKGKTYIGTSAGSIIAGPRLSDYHIESIKNTNLKSFEAYGFVNFLILPHWGSKSFKDFFFPDRIFQTYKDDQVPQILLTDNQYVCVEGDEFRVYDIGDV